MQTDPCFTYNIKQCTYSSLFIKLFVIAHAKVSTTGKPTKKEHTVNKFFKGRHLQHTKK